MCECLSGFHSRCTRGAVAASPRQRHRFDFLRCARCEFFGSRRQFTDGIAAGRGNHWFGSAVPVGVLIEERLHDLQHVVLGHLAVLRTESNFGLSFGTKRCEGFLGLEIGGVLTVVLNMQITELCDPHLAIHFSVLGLADFSVLRYWQCGSKCATLT